MNRTILFFGLSCVATLAFASGFDQVAKMQKSGMWEIASGEDKRKQRLYCVTDQQKIDARKSLGQATGDGSCKILRDTLSGDLFHLEMQCTFSAPDKKESATMLMTMTGKVTPVDIRTKVTNKVSGNSPTAQMLAKVLGETQTEYWRWIRPCKAGEKPGPQ